MRPFLIRLAVVIGLLSTGIYAAGLVVAYAISNYDLDLARQQRINKIMTALYQFEADNGYIPPEISTTATVIGSSGVDLDSHLVPNYLTAIPVDPVVGDSANTGFTIQLSPLGAIILTAPGAVKPAQPITLIR